mgnify:CR=1 FL=1
MWSHPESDGGETVTRYKVEWDTQSDFGSGSAGSIELPLVREVQSITAKGQGAGELTAANPRLTF